MYSSQLELWVVFLGFAVFGMVAGFVIGGWFVTKNDVIAEAEKIAMDALND